MRLQTFRDDNRNRHLELIGGKIHPWSIDIVVLTASAILVVGFACAVASLLVR